MIKIYCAKGNCTTHPNLWVLELIRVSSCKDDPNDIDSRAHNVTRGRGVSE